MLVVALTLRNQGGPDTYPHAPVESTGQAVDTGNVIAAALCPLEAGAPAIERMLRCVPSAC